MSSSPEITDLYKKRKRDVAPEDEDDKLEIDVNLPEPPSKKAKRKEKKQAKSKSSKTVATEEAGDKGEEKASDKKAATADATPTQAKRSDYGIWVGNLPFNATKDTLREFLLKEGGIDDSEITRVHLPIGARAQNKGFAYIDFKSAATLEVALTLSERLTGGRRLLIKNAKSFEGRPKETAATSVSNVSQKEPSKRVFVGNLSFDVTRDELAEHFGQAGKVEDVFMATFEDSGKSKGFAWVTFADIEAAKNAVQGYVWKEPELDDDDIVEVDESNPASKKIKKHKPRKWFINRLQGRDLRCEFAEDAQTRYKKRFGKATSTAADSQSRTIEDSAPGVEDTLESIAQEAATARSAPKKKDPKTKHLDKDQRQEERRKKFDARKIAPGAALANTARASGAIVAGKGSKMTFD